jgi:chromosome partitioning protein
MRRIAIVNQKGGTGKTVTAVTLAVGLARCGHRTLLIDCDAQANATWTVLGGQGAHPPTLASVLLRNADAADVIRSTPIERLDLLPADATLSGVNVALVQELGRDTRLRLAMATFEGQWDFVILDTGPTFTTVLANALVAATEVIVPVDPGVYAMLGLVALQETIAEVREVYGNTTLRLAGLLLTRVQRTKVAADVEAELRAKFGSLVFGSTIPLSAKIEEAATRGLTVMDHAPKSPGAVAYAQLVKEIANGRAKERRGGKAVRGAGESAA